jgi:hypothetical protein
VFDFTVLHQFSDFRKHCVEMQIDFLEKVDGYIQRRNAENDDTGDG